jgi:hypothetical protein
MHVFCQFDVVLKYLLLISSGLPKSGSQMSASFASNGKHIISIGEDSRIYVWNYNGWCIPSSQDTKSKRSYEHFISEGVTVAVPWSGSGIGHRSSESYISDYCSHTLDKIEVVSWVRDTERFYLGNWFFMDGPCKGSPRGSIIDNYFE